MAQYAVARERAEPHATYGIVVTGVHVYNYYQYSQSAVWRNISDL